MQGLTPTPAARTNLKGNENQLQAEEENVRIGLQGQYGKIEKKSKDPSGRRERNSGSSSSTDRENKSSSCSAEDQKKKRKERHHSSSTNRKHRSSSHSTEGEEKKHRSTKHREERHSKSSSSTDREDAHLKEVGHESNSHKEQHRSRSSGSARKRQEIEHTYAEINEQRIPSIVSPNLSLQDKPGATNFPKDEGLRHRNIQSISAPPKPLRAYLQTSDGTSTSSARSSSPPSYKSDEKRRDSEDIIYDHSWLKINLINSWSKFKAKLGYPIQQRAFVIPSVAFITFVASYSVLMPKYYASIQNLMKDPLLSIPIAIASVLFLASMAAFISNLRDTRIKVTGTKDDNEVFKKIKSINNEKCIRSIELNLSNNTRYTLLDGRKYKTLVFKKLALTLNRPLICAEVAAFVTLTSTYLLTKYFEIGYKNLADSLSTFNTSNIELIGFAAAASTILALFICSFVHYYRKECVEGLELKKCPRKIESFNEEYIREAESHYNNRDTLSSGKHSEGKAASLTIDQAVVEYYDSRAVIIAN